MNDESHLGAQPPDEGCLSDLALDRAVAAEPSPAQRLHLAGCARCSARLADFADARQADQPIVTRLAVRVAEAQAPRRRRWMWPAFGLATAAAGLMLIFVPAPEMRPPEAGVRAKGSALRFVVRRGDEVFPGRSGEPLRAGDALGFLITTDQPYFILVGLAAQTGAVTCYHPADGTASVRLEPVIDRPLPHSLVLDEGTDTDYFLGVFSAVPITRLEIETRARALIAGPPGSRLPAPLGLPGQEQWVGVPRARCGLGRLRAADPLDPTDPSAYGCAVDALASQTDILRRMTPSQRLRAAVRLYWSARALKAAAFRAQHPAWSETQVAAAVRRAFLHAST